MRFKATAIVVGTVALGVALLGLGLAGAYILLAHVWEVGDVTALDLPPAEILHPPGGTVQGLTVKQLREYHRKPQGTRILPLAWFDALERPTILPSGMVKDPEYLRRFGFSYDPVDGSNPGGALPIGFAIEENFYAPYAKPPVKTATRMVGLSCAACHTGRIEVVDKSGRRKGMLIEGGPAMIDVELFREALGRALFLTLKVPFRFDTFARAVLGERADFDGRKKELRADLEEYVATGVASNDLIREKKLMPVSAGFGRTDALGLIGNRVFGGLATENQTVADAPVSFPALWDSPWFDWVQYNAAVRPPMIRNIGEALGVGAVVNLEGPGEHLYESTVNVKTLSEVEDMLAGGKPLGLDPKSPGLRPPRWNDVIPRLLGPESRVAETAEDPTYRVGRDLYRKRCQGCHLPPTAELCGDDCARSEYFTGPDFPNGPRFLKVRVIDLSVVDTDPNQALNFYRRVAVTPKEGRRARERAGRLSPPKPDDTRAMIAETETLSAEEGLYRVASFIRARKYDDLGLFGPNKLADRRRYDRWRAVPLDSKAQATRDQLDRGDQDLILQGKGLEDAVYANLGYKARPLDGIWATPPYLHNGSVPSLRQLLLPVAERDREFHVGTTEYDPVEVGYKTHQVPGSTRLDTSISGNRNSGHEFRHLTAQELEERRPDPNKPAGQGDEQARLAAYFGMSRDEWVALAPKEKDEKLRGASEEALRRKPIRGVLGPRLTDKERDALIAFLKTL